MLARCTNEALVGIQMPLRRQKLEMQAEYDKNLAAAAEEEKEQMMSSFRERLNETELTVWLKDFPVTQADLQEMRRSAAQHMPEADIAIHTAIFIEEQFKIDYDELEAPPSNGNREVTPEQLAEQEAETARKLEEEFSREDRCDSYKELVKINKFAHSCPTSSHMKLFVPHRIKFIGPDPPADVPEPVEPEPVAEPVKKGKKDEVVAPVEIPKTPEQLAEEKMFLKFIKNLREEVEQLTADLTEYRKMTSGPNAPKMVPLLPIQLT